MARRNETIWKKDVKQQVLFISHSLLYAPNANLVEKSTSCAGAFFCLKHDKRCLNRGENEQKVSNKKSTFI